MVTEEGVCKLLQSLDVKKSVAPDSIPNIVLRQCAKDLVLRQYLTNRLKPARFRKTGETPIFRPYSKKEINTYLKTIDPFHSPQCRVSYWSISYVNTFLPISTNIQ